MTTVSRNLVEMHRFLDKGSRPVLTGAKVNGEEICATDGCILAVTAAPLELDGAHIPGEALARAAKGGKRNTPTLERDGTDTRVDGIGYPDIGGTFPNYAGLFPGPDMVTARVALSPDYLAALAAYAKAVGAVDVKFAIRGRENGGNTTECLNWRIVASDGTETRGLLMPMFIDGTACPPVDA